MKFEVFDWDLEKYENLDLRGIKGISMISKRFRGWYVQNIFGNQ